MIIKILLIAFTLLFVIIWLKVIAIIILFVIAGRQIINVLLESRGKKKSLNVEVLRPTRVLFSTENTIVPIIRIGRSNQFLYTDRQLAPNVYNFFNDIHLKITEQSGYLKIATYIRDKNGKVIAKIENNAWEIKPELKFDRNFTKDALEITDENDNVVFQVRTNNSYIELQGLFYGSRGNSLYLSEEAILISKNPKNPVSEKDISYPIIPIFKFPSEKYFGKLIQENIPDYSNKDPVFLNSKRLEKLLGAPTITLQKGQMLTKETVLKNISDALNQG